jgi:DNA helicase-2/ATP-dependent DNA helicase PcrA
MQLELRGSRFPTRSRSGVRFFEQAHIRDLVALLRFVYNPCDTAAWNRIAVLLPKVGDKNATKTPRRRARPRAADAAGLHRRA